MMARATFKGVHWMLLAFIALAPTAVFAQQEKAPEQAKAEQEKAPEQTKAQQPKAEPPKTEGAQAPAEGAQPPAEKERGISGMSVLGNQDAPKSLVIVPWKGSEIGKSLGISTMLDDSRQPVDKDVFMRVLSYYETRSQGTRQDGAPAATNAAPAKH
jgi:glucose/arabinose dehydrogenase